VGLRLGLDTLEKIKILYLCKQLNHESSDVQLAPLKKCTKKISIFIIVRCHRQLVFNIVELYHLMCLIMKVQGKYVYYLLLKCTVT